MLIAYSEIKLHPAVTIHDIADMAINRRTTITESDRMLNEQQLYQLSNEVGLWTLDELKKHFLN